MTLIKKLVEAPPIDPNAPRHPLNAQGQPAYPAMMHYKTSGTSVGLDGRTPLAVSQTVHLVQVSKLVKQLSDISKFSCEMFEDLDNEIGKTVQRVDKLKKRLDHIKQVLPVVEEKMGTMMAIDNLGMERGDYRSFQPIQQLFTKDTANPSIAKVYGECPPLPNLTVLDKFREDGQTCMKFYSYPQFFMERWKALMENVPKKKKKKVKKNKEAKQKEVKVSAVKVKKYNNMGELIVEEVEESIAAPPSAATNSQPSLVAPPASKPPASKPPVAPTQEIPTPAPVENIPQPAPAEAPTFDAPAVLAAPPPPKFFPPPLAPSMPPPPLHAPRGFPAEVIPAPVEEQNADYNEVEVEQSEAADQVNEMVEDPPNDIPEVPDAPPAPMAPLFSKDARRSFVPPPNMAPIEIPEPEWEDEPAPAPPPAPAFSKDARRSFIPPPMAAPIEIEEEEPPEPVIVKPAAPPPPPAPPAPPAPPPPPAPDMPSELSQEEIAEPENTSSLGGGVINVNAIGQAASRLKKATPIQKEPQKDVRGDMLQSIKGGTFALKKSVAAPKQAAAPAKPTNDVASILQRRVALEMSDSDEDEEDDEEDDEWN